MTRFFTTLFAAGIIAATAFTFQSCGNDEPDDNKPTDKDSEFVGAWQGDMGNFIFFNDGNAKLLGNNGIAFGKWTFDKDTRILATTLDKWQFKVTLSSDDAWAASDLAGISTYTFDRIEENDNEYLFNFLSGAKCTDEEGEVTTIGDVRAEKLYGIMNSKFFYAIDFPGLDGYISFEESDSKNNRVFKYTLYSLQYHYNSYQEYGTYYFHRQHGGEATFSNLHSSVCTLNIKSNDTKKEDEVRRTFKIDNTKPAAAK